MKTVNKSAGLLDDSIESQVEHSADESNVDFVESLYQACSVSLIHLWHSRLRFMSHGPRLNTLKKDVANLRLWEENFLTGRLDVILQQSSRLKANVVENLKGIGEILICYFLGSDENMINPQIESSSIRNLVEELRSLLDNAAIFLSDEEKSNSSSDEDTSDDSSSSTDRELQRYGRLHSYVVCLMDLVPAIERHALCLQQRVAHLPYSNDKVFHMSEGALPFATRISDRFTTAPTALVEKLAEANWERFLRIREQVEEEDGGDTTTQFKPYSIFHDSGIGTSNPKGSQYAATAASHKSFLSNSEEQSQYRPRVPNLLHDYGLPFKCDYCQNVITMRNRVDWKMHVFADLQSYLCTHAECKDALKTYTSRDTWARHEINEHLSQSQWRCYKCKFTTTTQEDFPKHLNIAHTIRLSGHPLKATLAEADEIVSKPDFEDYKCPLCSQSDWRSSKEYTIHVGRHLEEISLACLPLNQDCDSDVDLEIDTSSNAAKDSLSPVHSTTSNYHDSALTAIPDLGSFDALESPNQGQDFNKFSGREFFEVTPTRQRPTTSQTIQNFNTGSILPDQYNRLVPRFHASVPTTVRANAKSAKKQLIQCITCGIGFGTVGALQRHIEDRHHPCVKISCPEPGCQEVSRRRDKARDHCSLKHQWKPSNEGLALYTQPMPCPPVCYYCTTVVSDWKSFYRCFINHCSISNTSKYGESSSENDDIDDGGGGRFVPSKIHLNIPREKERVPSTKGHESGGWGEGPSKDYPSMSSAGEKSSSTKAIATDLKESTATTPERPQ
ncbi:hypothetical protein N7494_010021 [Penicillium frequentans]|uniref:C2H2-type domain-containing protein n=1 Tax=Penicillium frequentans TaxID=3151616 RepID=A0AAD6CR29_9EURO|nr:hypothetical protein N7494_010021 [Penicillium glabrum]